MKLSIKEVKSKKDLKAFIRFPLELYKDNAYFVPSILMEEAETFNPKKNPAFEFCETKLWIAHNENGKIVGRIAAILNHKANEAWDQKYMRFGWIDFIDDYDVSSALMQKVEEWAKEKGMEAVNGPLGFSDMDKEGMLIEGFEEEGTIATIYNHPYYPEHMDKLGYAKDADWFEYEVMVPEGVPDRVHRIADIVKKKFGLRMLNVKKAKELLPYADQIFDVLNQAFKPVYGFAGLSDRQKKYYTKKYFSYIKPQYVPVIMNDEDQVVGFGITMPSMSKAMQKIKGKLLPFGWYHLLQAMKKRDTIDFYLIGVLPEYQKKGVNAILFDYLIPIYIKEGYRKAETNVELENNEMVRRQWEGYDYRIHKKRRAYLKKI